MDKVILAVETAIGQGSISLLKGGKVIGFRLGESAKTRASDLISQISGLLEKSNVQKQEVDLIAVSTGPGSLTGARIGIATSKALAYSLDCPCLSVSILEALANKSKALNACVVLPAGKDRYYLQFFSNVNETWISETGILMVGEEDLIPLIQSYQPENLWFEKASYLTFVNLLASITPKIDVFLASDNLSEYIAKFFQQKPLENTKSIDIEPIYIENFFIKRPFQ